MAVLLDTNVVSELLRPSPDPAVEMWVGIRPATDLYFSAVGEAELRYGVAILPTGRCRDTLAFAMGITYVSAEIADLVLQTSWAQHAAVRDATI